MEIQFLPDGALAAGFSRIVSAVDENWQNRGDGTSATQ